MNKKKILFYNDLISGGGVEKLMYDLVWALHDKYDITVLSYFYDEDFYEKYPENVGYISEQVPHEYKDNIFIHILSSINRRLYENLLVSRVNGKDFDLMLCMKDGNTMKGALRYDIPRKIAWVHTDYNAYYYTKNIFGTAEAERNAMQQFEKVVCVAEDIKKGICDVIGDPGNLVVKYNPINIENVLEKSMEPVVDLEDFDGIRFVTVGRLNMQKGYDLLLEAARFLECEGYKFEVDVIGGPEFDGEEANRLYAKKELLEVKNVHFIGARHNSYKYINAGDWFLSTSRFEGYSLVSQEAALLDKPLLLTRCSGVRELIGDDEFGISMECSVWGIVDGIRKVLTDESLTDKYQKAISNRKSIITYEERISEIEEMF